MIKVMIKETGKVETLEIIDKNGTDFTADFIGNTGALIDGQFALDNETGTYICDQDTYDWWSKVIADHQALEERIEALKEEHGSDKVIKVLNATGEYDLEDQAAVYNHALDEAFGTEA